MNERINLNLDLDNIIAQEEEQQTDKKVSSLMNLRGKQVKLNEVIGETRKQGREPNQESLNALETINDESKILMADELVQAAVVQEAFEEDKNRTEEIILNAVKKATHESGLKYTPYMSEAKDELFVDWIKDTDGTWTITIGNSKRIMSNEFVKNDTAVNAFKEKLFEELKKHLLKPELKHIGETEDHERNFLIRHIKIELK